MAWSRVVASGHGVSGTRSVAGLGWRYPDAARRATAREGTGDSARPRRPQRDTRRVDRRALGARPAGHRTPPDPQADLPPAGSDPGRDPDRGPGVPDPAGTR